jgi:hypothetical protein
MLITDHTVSAGILTNTFQCQYSRQTLLLVTDTEQEDSTAHPLHGNCPASIRPVLSLTIGYSEERVTRHSLRVSSEQIPDVEENYGPRSPNIDKGLVP